MRELSVAGLLVGCLALLAVVLFVFHDGQTLTSPPEAVAEDFVKRLAAHRPERARDRLSERARPEYPAKRLAAWFRDVESVVDPISHVDGTDTGIAKEEAWATLVVSNHERTVEIRLGLVRERGAWWVDRLPGPDEFSP
jgi:hypothetical protein